MKARPPLPDDIKQLMALVRKGKLFDVQKWIAEDKRTVPPKPYWFSPLRVAIQTGFHSMVEVLLRAGIDQEEKDYMLSNAVWNSNFDLIQLLADYGADVQSVDFEDACRTGNPEIMRFFVDRGIDVVTNQPFACALRHPKRPHLGIYMRYRDKIPDLKHQANLALRYHAQTGNLKWVCLLLWAGANPHIPLPEIGDESDPEYDSTALEEAVRFERREIMEKIGITPEADLDRLLKIACSNCDGPLVEKLLALGASPEGTDPAYSPMERLIFEVEWQMRPRIGYFCESKFEASLDAVVRFSNHGARWRPKKKYEINGFRRCLYCLEPRLIKKIIRTFSENHICSPDVLLKLLTTSKMKQLLGGEYAKMVQSIDGP